MTKTSTKPEIIATAPTSHGFMIGILKMRNGYAVVRLDDTYAYVVLGRRGTERDARAFANIEWKRDMGR